VWLFALPLTAKSAAVIFSVFLSLIFIGFIFSPWLLVVGCPAKQAIATQSSCYGLPAIFARMF
jgi:hypothetical protein